MFSTVKYLKHCLQYQYHYCPVATKALSKSHSQHALACMAMHGLVESLSSAGMQPGVVLALSTYSVVPGE